MGRADVDCEGASSFGGRGVGRKGRAVVADEAERLVDVKSGIKMGAENVAEGRRGGGTGRFVADLGTFQHDRK